MIVVMRMMKMMMTMMRMLTVTDGENFSYDQYHHAFHHHGNHSQ